MFDFENKVVVITGASSGLGKQLAEAFASRKANLVTIARRIDRLNEHKQQLENEYKIKVLPIKCNVTNADDIKNAATLCEKEFGKADVLINCAGASKDKGILDMTDEEWNFTIETDLSSVFKVTREFAKMLKQNKYGRIINISSMYGLVGNTEIPTIAYHSSKGGVVNFTRAVAAELAPYSITCNCICPGYFETELTTQVLNTEKFQQFAQTHVPMQRYGKEGELNAGAIFLASEEASYVTGAILTIDGGYTCI